jgi:hypothetical protein
LSERKPLFPRAPLESATTMKWEYISVAFVASGFWAGGKLDGDAFNGELNKLGREGWELVSIFDTNTASGETRDVFAVFKRRAPGSVVP